MSSETQKKVVVKKVVKKGVAKRTIKSAQLTPTADDKGNQILKAGQHNLQSGKYNVHGVVIELSGRVFVANDKVNWIPVKRCGYCKTNRPEKVRAFSESGKTVFIAKCNNTKTCQYHGSYVWVSDYVIIDA